MTNVKSRSTRLLRGNVNDREIIWMLRVELHRAEGHNMRYSKCIKEVDDKTGGSGGGDDDEDDDDDDVI